MIEKLDIPESTVIDPSVLWGGINDNVLAAKINEVIDAVNTIQKEREAERFEIQEWIGILEAVRKSVNKHGKLIDTLVEENNIHEEQIDELQMKVEPEKCKPVENTTNSKMENVDPYAEQRKWIGKLCKFWFADAEHPTFGILDFVDAGPHPEPFHTDCGESEQGWYPHCELVKPDDDIIYKGE